MRRSQKGFTLVEVTVTLLVVGMVLVFNMQGLQNSLVQAAQTRNLKIARELSLYSLANLESGLFIDDIEDHMDGDYSEQDYPDFRWEIVLGTEEFDEEPDEDDPDRFDSWTNEDEDDEDESESTEPWVVARVKVHFPAVTGRRSNIVVERWLTRELVYGEESEEEDQ